jgi:hypothetical protein
MEQNDMQGHGPVTTFLIFLISGCQLMTMTQFDNWTHVLARIIELVGGILLIVINWDKAMKIISTKLKTLANKKWRDSK